MIGKPVCSSIYYMYFKYLGRLAGPVRSVGSTAELVVKSEASLLGLAHFFTSCQLLVKYEYWFTT